jgi:hypothetical protein
MFSHAELREMYLAAVPGKTRVGVVSSWPNPPYQKYHDNFSDTCYQWLDKPVALYNLCFKHGTLVIKTIN